MPAGSCEVKSPHGTRVDEHYWLRDDTRANPDMLAHLAAENAYQDAMLASVRSLEERVYGEIIARIRQDDASVPYRKRGYWYYSRYETGREYPVHARREGTPDAPEQVLVDENERAQGHDFYDLGELEVSPDNRILACTEDTMGRRQYTLRFKDLATGEMLPDVIANVEPDVAWAADSRTVLYVEKDPQTLLGNRVRRHVLGTDPRHDPVVFEEHDESFYLGVDTSKDGRYLFIGLQSTVSTEQHYAATDDPTLEFRVILPRERDHEYHADHFDGRWIIRVARPPPVARAGGAPHGRLHRWLQRVRRIPRHRGALRRPAQGAHPPVAGRRGLLHRPGRVGLRHGARRQRGTGQRRGALRL